jgi:hypothetical protein
MVESSAATAKWRPVASRDERGPDWDPFRVRMCGADGASGDTGDSMCPTAKTQRDVPETHFQSPTEVVKDKRLTHEDKKTALNTWEQDARQLLTASNEGMPGSEEGLDKENHHRLGEVIRAKGKIGQPPKHKPSH